MSLFAAIETNALDLFLPYSAVAPLSVVSEQSLSHYFAFLDQPTTQKKVRQQKYI